MAEDLWLSMLSTSMKVRDLRRDPRIWMNSVITGPEPSAEIKLRGTAHAETGDAVLERYAAAVAATLGWRPIGIHGSQ